MSERSRVVIIGAGPTGLGAARRLTELGCSDWLLLEAGGQPGGLAASFVDERGFTWDIGGHVQFSHYEYFDSVMDDLLGPDGWLTHERESWVWLRGRFVPYPFQNNIRLLPHDDAERCLHGLVDIVESPRPAPNHFGEWMEAKFGRGIVDVFMRPYNFKVWAHPAEAMSASWVGERVAVTDLRRVLSNFVHGRDDVSWGPNSTFRFPLRGGTGAVWKACAERLPKNHLRYGCPVAHVDLDSKVLTTRSGHRIKYDTLVSTMPLDVLADLSQQAELAAVARNGLLRSSSNIVGIGLNGAPPEALRRKCWMYFPEDDCPFYRVTVFSNYSPNNVRDPSSQWSLMAEVSESQHKPVDSLSLVDSVVDGALATGLIRDRGDVVSTWRYRAEYGYPIPSVGRDNALAVMLPFFESHDVLSRGRFGAWKYEVSNQDHSFMQGVEAAERIINGRSEVTVFDPEYANSRKHAWPFGCWNS
jgi:protoporphyrinogen oxidase